MVKPRQIRKIATNPAAYARFIATGALPQLIKPSGPLIDLLSQLSPRDRIAIIGLTVDAGLGYAGSRTFQNAEQALAWAAPRHDMVEGDTWPAESWRMKRFAGPLYLDDVLSRAASFPPRLLAAYPILTRPNHRPTERASRPDQEPPTDNPAEDPGPRPSLPG